MWCQYCVWTEHDFVSCCIDGLRVTTDWIFATRGKGLWNIDLKRFGCGHIDRFLLTLALPLIKAIRPVLHHIPSLFDVFRMVVSRADLVGIGARQLGADPFRVVANFIACRDNGTMYAGMSLSCRRRP